MRALRTVRIGTVLALAVLWTAALCRRAQQTPAAVPRSEGDVMLTICYDNHPGEPGLRPAWGFACVVQGMDKTILFDTGGDGDTLLANMQELGIEPAHIDAVVLRASNRMSL